MRRGIGKGRKDEDGEGGGTREARVNGKRDKEKKETM